MTFFNITNIFSSSSSSAAITLGCVDRESPFLKNKLKMTDCLLVTETKKQANKNQTGDDDMFIFNIVKCSSANPKFCNKAKKNLEITGQIITKFLKFKVPVIVEVSFSRLDSGVLGSAGPTRLHLMKSKDGIFRLYPQSLLKQFELTTHTEYRPSDIQAEFNSNVDYWFEDDVTPVKKSQIGFVELILHELIHGLGFISAWDSYFDDVEVLTPFIYYQNTEFHGFIEGIFDKFLILSDGTPLTNFTNELNKFAPEGTKFDSMYDLYNKFRASSQYKIATDMLNYSTTALSFGFLPEGSDYQTIATNSSKINDELYYLETSLRPYLMGSSVSHVSQDLYAKSNEFLMTWIQDPGRGLNDAIKDGGNYTGGAIGPKLKSVFESMGYVTGNNSEPEIPLPDDDIPSKSSSNNSNKLLMILLFILQFIFNLI
ncbi:691_t:CDS:2 [Entrophospora sp. SA101]|nr:15111_t:CDS:2 [Entrophospora sp. SA101]CAJ0641102.1 14450_t:CDS:2 [Entrophospora sp. SA101]CAJ0651138.1 691_t:CDS:2 [Entrophospora sp. SA101]CAJ0831715.1 3879_t:CDS:2 [Entrophospora sp. SA101]CAJ0846760.1 6070_t:CDS:2 [Entrophospora sp. SA101]